MKSNIVVQISWSHYCWKRFQGRNEENERVITGLSVDSLYRLPVQIDLS